MNRTSQNAAGKLTMKRPRDLSSNPGVMHSLKGPNLQMVETWNSDSEIHAMSSTQLVLRRLIERAIFVLLVFAVPAMPAVLLTLAPAPAMAQGDDDDDDDGGGGDPDPIVIPPIGFSTSAVGGVAIDADGVLANSTVDQLGRLREMRLKLWHEVPEDVSTWSDMRLVSLRRLEAAIAKLIEEGEPLSDDIVHLAGLQRIRYVFVDPEHQDIILAGPAEGWKLDERGNVVGVSSGMPTLWLDDLLVALRTAEVAAQGGISCSIDPTPEGLQRLQQYFAGPGRRIGPNTIVDVEQSLGPQQITVTGVPANSHFANVLVAADYRMKRLAMGLEEAPIRGMPSFLSMIRSSRALGKNALPRWWLATDYESLLRDEEGLAWELRGSGVKAMSEEDMLQSNGQIERSVGTNPLAQQWADNMTKKYDELAVAEPIFGQLRAVMDMAIVSALIVKENLPAKSGYSLPLLLDPTELQVARMHAPRQVDSQASVIKRRGDYIVSASGGVSINSWEVAHNTEVDTKLATLRSKALSTPDRWWWDHESR